MAWRVTSHGAAPAPSFCAVVAESSAECGCYNCDMDSATTRRMTYRCDVDSATNAQNDEGSDQ